MTGAHETNEPSPTALMNLVSGMKIAKAISVANELGLFDSLSTQPADISEIARIHNLAVRPTEMLCTVCAALGLLRKTNDEYSNSPITEAFLVRNSEYYIGDYIEGFDKRAFHGWVRLSEAVRSNRPTAWDADSRDIPFDESDPLMVQTFWRAMHALSRYTARGLNSVVNLTGDERVLDIGGGGGAFAIELCNRNPSLRVSIYDLPFVCDLTAPAIEKAGLIDRVDFKPGNFFEDLALPTGHDICLLSMVLHDWGRDENLVILRKVYASLPSGGRVFLCELFLNEDGTGPLEAAVMNLAMLVETRQGQNYSRAECTSWLTSIGFLDVQFLPFEGLSANGVVVATRP